MDVLTSAYYAAGEPPTPDELEGTCARCGAPSPHLTRNAKRAIVSEQFTAYDTWHNPSGAGLCPPCTWAHTHAPLREHPHQVTATLCRPLTRPELADLLTSPVGPTTALLVPLRPGRKYLLPSATWGHVTTDDTALPWTTADTRRLAAVQRLRGAGFGPRMLTEPAPPFTVLHRLPAADWADVITDWNHLEPWRNRRPWFDLALHATTPTSKKAAT